MSITSRCLPDLDRFKTSLGVELGPGDSTRFLLWRNPKMAAICTALVALAFYSTTSNDTIAGQSARSTESAAKVIRI